MFLSDLMRWSGAWEIISWCGVWWHYFKCWWTWKFFVCFWLKYINGFMCIIQGWSQEFWWGGDEGWQWGCDDEGWWGGRLRWTRAIKFGLEGGLSFLVSSRVLLDLIHLWGGQFDVLCTNLLHLSFFTRICPPIHQSLTLNPSPRLRVFYDLM